MCSTQEATAPLTSVKNLKVFLITAVCFCFLLSLWWSQTEVNKLGSKQYKLIPYTSLQTETQVQSLIDNPASCL